MQNQYGRLKLKLFLPKQKFNNFGNIFIYCQIYYIFASK